MKRVLSTRQSPKLPRKGWEKRLEGSEKGAGMRRLGSSELMVATFPDGPLPHEVAERLREMRGSRGAKLLDVLYISRDRDGIVSVKPDPTGSGCGPERPGEVLLQILEGDHLAGPDTDEYEIRIAGEIGFDIEALEGLVYRIPLGTSALLVLVEAGWTESLLDVISATGGMGRLLGFLENETMLLVGPQLARAEMLFDEAERAVVERGREMLEALGREPGRVPEALEALVAGGVLRDADLATAIEVLGGAGVIPASRAESG